MTNKLDMQTRHAGANTMLEGFALQLLYMVHDRVFTVAQAYEIVEWLASHGVKP
jgi:ATPase subunit of ABC transporter with duplicated ATPase domains